jgi:hypothetical protein
MKPGDRKSPGSSVISNIRISVKMIQMIIKEDVCGSEKNLGGFVLILF